MNMADALRPYDRSLHQRDRGCLGKVAYDTRKEAARKGRVWNERPYRCDFCGRWHLSKKHMGEGGGVHR